MLRSKVQHLRGSTKHSFVHYSPSLSYGGRISNGNLACYHSQLFNHCCSGCFSQTCIMKKSSNNNNNNSSFFMNQRTFHVNTSQQRKSVDLEQVQEVVSRENEGVHPLDKFFKPRSIVVIGASEAQGTSGRTILWNLMSCRNVKVYPINTTKKSREVMGLTAYSSVDAIFDSLNISSIDLAIICTPREQVLNSVRECINNGIKAAVLVNPHATSTQFSMTQSHDVQELYKQVRDEARKGGLRLLGPDCLGVMTPSTGSDGRTVFINATYTSAAAIPGRIAVISQTSEMGITVLDWGLKKHVGFSAFMSVGSMLDISWGDLIEYYGRDENTDAILLYMESIGSIENARQFISAARNVALKKPIILIKSGRADSPTQINDQSRTTSLIHSDSVLDTIFERCGVLRVDTIEDLFNMAQVLSKQPRPKSNRIGLISNSRSAAMLAMDSLIGKGELAELNKSTIDELTQHLPDNTQIKNPLDILPDAKPERYIHAMEAMAKDSNIDAILAILTPQELTEPTRTAQLIKQQFSTSLVNKTLNKQPVILTCWMGGLETEVGRDLLVGAGIPSFIFPDTVVNVFNYMWRYSKNLENLYEIPSKSERQESTLLGPVNEQNIQQARLMLEQILESGRRILNEHESKTILELYGIPTAKSIICTTVEEAQQAAEAIGYPVVMKLHSDTLTHKLEVDGVKLNLQDGEAIKRCFAKIKNGVEKYGKGADFKGVTVQPMVKQLGYHSTFELILGSTYDRQFGPILLFGSGGSYVQVHEDIALAVPPLTNSLARKMIKKTKISRVLEGYRMKAGIDMDQLQHLLVRFSQLVIDLSPFIKSIDVNPIKISSAPLLGTSDQKLVALDARIILHPEGYRKDISPVIRSYPSDYITNIELKDGVHAVIRPLRFEDHPALVDFFGSLSKEQLELSSREEALNYENTFFNLKKQQEQIAGQTANQTDKPEMLQLQNDPVGKQIYNELVQMCIGDYDREIVIAAEVDDRIVAMGRYTISPVSTSSNKVAELAILVGESYQKHGLGKSILNELVKIARKEKVNELVAHVHASNVGMQNVTTKLGFKRKSGSSEKPGFIVLSLVL